MISDRRAGQDQLLELDLELIEVPLPLFAQTINGKTATGAARRRSDGRSRKARRVAKAQAGARLGCGSRRPEPGCPYRSVRKHAEARKRADRARHFIDMSRVEFAHRARRHAEIVDRDVNEMKPRQGIVSHSTSLDALPVRAG